MSAPDAFSQTPRYSIARVLESARPLIADHPKPVKFSRGVGYKGGVFGASMARSRVVAT